MLRRLNSSLEEWESDWRGIEARIHAEKGVE